MDDLHLLLLDESFQRWLSGQASNEEEKKWENWLLETPNASSLYEQASTIWRLTQYKPADIPDINIEWKKLKLTLHQKKERYSSLLNFGYSIPKLFKLKRNANIHQWKKTSS